jgi:hypothetical protein
MDRSIELTFGDGHDSSTLEMSLSGLNGFQIKVNDDDEHGGEAIVNSQGITTTFYKGVAWWVSAHSWAWNDINEIHVY